MGGWHEMDCGVAGGWPHDSSLCEAKDKQHICRLLPRLSDEDLEDVEMLVRDLRRDSDMKWPGLHDPIAQVLLDQGERIAEEFGDESS